MNKIIDIKNLSYQKEKNQILTDISFDVEAGDFLGIIGPNGSGKTSLIKLLLGINSPSFGQINIDKDYLKDKSISFVSQQVYSEYKHFPITVLEVVRMGLFAKKPGLKFFNKEDDQQVYAMLEKLNIENLAHSQMTRLSGGERQRVLLGRSLISNPKVIILDEPTSALDPEFREEFYKIIKEINQLGVTIIIVSHDLGVLEAYVNKILYIDQSVKFFGKISDYNNSQLYTNEVGDKHA